MIKMHLKYLIKNMTSLKKELLELEKKYLFLKKYGSNK